MEISGSALAMQAMAVNQAETGGNILQKTLEKTAEAQQQSSSKSQAAFTGKGLHINVKA